MKRPSRGNHPQEVSLLLIKRVGKERLHIRAHSGDCDFTHSLRQSSRRFGKDILMVRILRVDVVAEMRQRRRDDPGLVCVASQIFGLGTPSPDAFGYGHSLIVYGLQGFLPPN